MDLDTVATLLGMVVSVLAIIGYAHRATKQVEHTIGAKVDALAVVVDRNRESAERAIDGLRGETADLGKGLRGEMADLGKGLRGEMADLGKGLRGEMADLAKGLRGEMADLRKGLRGEMADLGTALRGEMADLRTELKQDMSELRTEFRQDMADLRITVARIDDRVYELATRGGPGSLIVPGR